MIQRFYPVVIDGFQNMKINFLQSMEKMGKQEEQKVEKKQ